MSIAATSSRPLPPFLGRPLLVGLVAAVGIGFAPVGADGPTMCPFALITGTACPGCGMTRAIVALAHGDLALSWWYHPLAGLVVAELLLGYGWWIAARAGWVRRPSPSLMATFVASTGVGLLVVWLARLGLGTLPPV